MFSLISYSRVIFYIIDMQIFKRKNKNVVKNNNLYDRSSQYLTIRNTLIYVNGYCGTQTFNRDIFEVYEMS